MRKRLDIFIAAAFSITFFVIGIATLSHYGISWDDPAHYVRGKAYLNYFLSPFLGSNPQLPRRSMYQFSTMTAQYYRFNDSGHPPLNGILFAASNRLFYETLGILGDIEAYSIMGVLLSSLFVGIIVWFAMGELGGIAGVVSGLALFLYPIFLAETHFNVKDPPLTVFFGIAAILFYRAVTTCSRKLILLFGVVFGFALATKLNSGFLPIPLGIWFLYYWVSQTASVRTRLHGLVVLFPVAGAIAVSIFFWSWPFLWTDPVGHFAKILQYYVSIGTYQSYQPNYWFFGVNIYPVVWIGLTTPLVTLVLAVAGMIAALWDTARKKNSFGVFLLLWLSIPIARASAPGTSVYGGARLLMEYVQALCLLAGYGAHALAGAEQRRRRLIVLSLIFVGFLLALVKLVRIHPNETLYMNELIGGLRGAYALQLPSAGEDLGNIYRQGAQWLNAHAEQGAKLTLVHRGTSALPRPFLRPDIVFDDSVWSGYAQDGEYIMEATSMDFSTISYFEPRFLTRMLQPVHEIFVDDIAVLKIWKNSDTLLNPMYRHTQTTTARIQKSDAGLFLDTGGVQMVASFRLTFDPSGCRDLGIIQVATSPDGASWKTSDLPITDAGLYRLYTLDTMQGTLVYNIPGDQMRWIRLVSDRPNACVTDGVRKATVTAFVGGGKSE